jgi:hypothetical protein
MYSFCANQMKVETKSRPRDLNYALISGIPAVQVVNQHSSQYEEKEHKGKSAGDDYAFIKRIPLAVLYESVLCAYIGWIKQGVVLWWMEVHNTSISSADAVTRE